MEKVYIIEIKSKKNGRLLPSTGMFFTSRQSALNTLNGRYLESMLSKGLYEAEIKLLWNSDEPPF